MQRKRTEATGEVDTGATRATRSSARNKAMGSQGDGASSVASQETATAFEVRFLLCQHAPPPHTSRCRILQQKRRGKHLRRQPRLRRHPRRRPPRNSSLCASALIPHPCKPNLNPSPQRGRGKRAGYLTPHMASSLTATLQGHAEPDGIRNPK